MRSQLLMVVMSIYAHTCLAQFPGVSQYNSREQVPDRQAAAEFWRDASQRMLQNARRIVTPSLTAREREIESTINYLVSASGNINAFAYTNEGRRYIRLTGMSAQFFGWIATAESMAIESKNEECFQGYMRYLLSQIVGNSRSVESGGQPRVTWDPQNAASKRIVGQCSASDQQYSRVVAAEQQYIARMAEASFLLLWLHEVGHHVLGHVDQPATSLSVRRERESDADEWAVRAMARANQFPSVGRPFFYFLSIFQGMSLEDERRSSHPMGVRRARNIFSTIRSSVLQNEQMMHAIRRTSGGEAQFLSDLAGMERQASALIPER